MITVSYNIIIGVKRGGDTMANKKKLAKLTSLQEELKNNKELTEQQRSDMEAECTKLCNEIHEEINLKNLWYSASMNYML